MKTAKFAPFAFGLAAALALAGCAATTPATSNEPAATMTQDASGSMDPTPGSMEGDGGTGEAVVNDAVVNDAVVNDKLKFAATTLAGEAFDGTSLAGTDAILWFWAPWCPTCRSEAPDIALAAAQLPEGVTMYGVPGNADAADMQKFVDDYGLGDIVQIVDADGSLWSTFGVPSQPAFALINDNGEITTLQGSLGLDSILDEANALLEN